MSKTKMTPKALSLTMREDKKTGRLKDSLLIFKDEDDEMQVKLDKDIMRCLRDILSEIIHKDEMKEECGGYRIVDD